MARHRADGSWDDRTLADGIEAAAGRRPDTVALIDGDGRLAWAGLAAAVAQGLASLRGHGVGPGDGVVLVSGNTRHGVIAYHALLRLGTTVAVLDRRCGPADVQVALDALPGRPRVIVAADEAGRLGDVLAGAETLPLELFGASRARPPRRRGTSRTGTAPRSSSSAREPPAGRRASRTPSTP
ncbi:AMP-binding protein [Frankia sp. AgW1.1]|uniref:AMP-binding protein n=1 Tax=Frankia sp. AgW1.1 TaxID=1836971 RepID=UPI0027DDE695|nr:AMP-binding protein [Frankia sp. AgW1.1]